MITSLLPPESREETKDSTPAQQANVFIKKERACPTPVFRFYVRGIIANEIVIQQYCQQMAMATDGETDITWLCYSYHELLRLLLIPGGCYVHRFACRSPWFLVLLCLFAVVLVFWLVMKRLPYPLRGGTTASFFFFFFLLFLFRFATCFLFLFVCFLCVLFHRMCMSCLSIQYDGMALRCLLCLLQTRYQSSTSVAWFCDHIRRSCTSQRRSGESARTLVVPDVYG